MPRSFIKVTSDIGVCERLWNKFSPKRSLFHTWDFRRAWFTAYGYEPYFIHLDDGGASCGLLPLWHNTDDNKYEFVGGEWPEDNVFFAPSGPVIRRLIQAAPRPLELCALVPFDGMDKLSKIGSLRQDEELKYVLPLDTVETFDGLLSQFAKKYRYNLRYDYKRIMAQNAQVTWTDTTDPDYFDAYVKLKGVVFNTEGKDENYYEDKRRKEAFRQIIKNASDYKVRIMEIKIDGTLAGIDITIIYDGTYYLIGGAYDIKRFSGAGNAALYLLFEDAVKQNAKLIDCLQEDSGWKHRYFEGRPLYIFTKE